ncbi:hypothetical protein SAMN05518865_12725 [Duganella sp. CF458]|uniref:hypothetical protein n=1 Tax=Duganella sp. CF458 TaxID=1884368 RepID=UPI0008EAB100|nr:hypothetical protein [Duganella sp. CF458]SFG98900.1 hypothetical protein SAMN05518865_12725 [Duganella sp. CF458]
MLMKKIGHFLLSAVLALIQALLAALIVGLIGKNGELGALVFLAGWPALTYYGMRSDGARQTVHRFLRSIIVPLILIPVVAIIALFGLIAGKSATSAGAPAAAAAGVGAVVLVIVLGGFGWGAAFVAFVASRFTKKKPPAK